MLPPATSDDAHIVDMLALWLHEILGGLLRASFVCNMSSDRATSSSLSNPRFNLADDTDDLKAPHEAECCGQGGRVQRKVAPAKMKGAKTRKKKSKAAKESKKNKKKRETDPRMMKMMLVRTFFGSSVVERMPASDKFPPNMLARCEVL